MRWLTILLLPALASADPHPMSSGANPAPTVETQIAMTAETLTIDIENKAAAVAAAVTLVNKGPATKLVVGFPCAAGKDAGQVDVPCKVPLKITANKKPIAAKLVRAKKAARWEWPMKFAADEQVDVVVKYRAPLVNDRYSVPASGMGIFTYRLTTGARWAGPIGKLDITVNHMHEALLFISPAGYSRQPGRITWSLTDYEPTEEVAVIPHPSGGHALAGSVGAKTAAEMKAKLDANDFAKADIDRILADLQRDQDLVDNWLPMIAKLGGIAEPAKDRARAVIAESVKILEELKKRAKR
jgi:hypothetical protein